ncbi:MAG: hypothetical protein HRT58_05710 [Crocinitomicaceae bacterium]|nr:hypothetical protein [Flavobacteriales bacterium]NQZ35137.1 hypothetical protein [Crocinitomicaceae bacterium]
MMRYLIIVIGLIFVSSLAQAQDSVVVVIELNDSKENDPINNAQGTFTFNGKNQLITSQSKGIIYLKTTVGTSINARITHPLYEGIYKTIKISKNYAYDSIFFQYEMEFDKIQEVIGVEVVAPGIPKVVYKSKRLHVQDFEILEDGRLILLTYPKQLKKGSELLLYDGSRVVNTFSIPGVATDLIRDYRGNPHVVCKENVFGIHVDKNKISISNLEKEYFTKYVAPIVDTNTSKMYFSTFNPDYPAFEYFAYDQLDSSYLKIIGIEDEFMMELYRSEYKWVDVRTKLWAKNREIQTGIDAEIWVGANYFTQSLYYKEVYAPLFHRNDSLFVFDYYKDKQFIFNAAGKKLDSTTLYHHYQPKQTGWQKHLIQDLSTGQIYAVYDRAGYTYIGWVDTKTGEINQQVRLSKRYAEHIKIDGNYVYYVYRKFESIDKKHLWKERLPYDFGIGTVFLPEGDEASGNE